MKKTVLLFVLVTWILTIMAIPVVEDVNKAMVETWKKATKEGRWDGDMQALSFYPAYLAIALNYNYIGATFVENQEWVNDEWITSVTMNATYENDNIVEVVMIMSIEEQEVMQRYEITWSGGNISQIDIYMTLEGEEYFTFRETYEYQGDVLLSYLNQMNAMDQFFDYERGSYTIQNGNIVGGLIEVNEVVNWVNSERYTGEYSGDKLTEFVTEFWQDEWIPEYRDQYTYNGDLLNENLTQTWSGTEWYNSDLMVYDYSGSQIESYMAFEWDGSEWYESIQGSLTYDNSDRIVELLTQEWFFGAREWVNSSRELFNYGTAVNEHNIQPAVSVIRAYPNPFNPVLNLEISCQKNEPVMVEIFNLKGERIVTLYNDVTTSESLKLTWNADSASNTSMSSGVYFVKVKTPEMTDCSKILLLK